MLDGVPVTRNFLRHDEIMVGETLRFVTQAKPNKA